MIKFLLAAVATLLPISHYALSDQALKERMISDVDVIRSALEVGYAPREWKSKHAGWDFEREIANVKEKIRKLSQPTVKSYQYLLRDFFTTMQDYHVGIYFHATEKATLPFDVKGANGRYFITYVDTDRLSPSVYPINIGDELVSFDGKPVEKVIQEFIDQYLRGSNENTDRAHAEYFLTLRAAAVGHVVPKGPITIGVRPKDHAQDLSKVASYQLIWDHTPEKISNGSLGDLYQAPARGSKEAPLVGRELFNLKMVSPLYEALKENEAIELSDEPSHLMGATKSFIPPLGRIWWQQETYSSFHAYLYETDQRQLIGYIRIPDYEGDDRKVAEFAELIRFMEERSDALVIDQINNPGGLLFYCYALLSMLTETPLETPLHRLSITQEDVANALDMLPILETAANDSDAQLLIGETFYGMPVTYQMARFLITFCNFIIDEWNAGHTLTSPYFLFNIDHVNPNPNVRYTKPILVLINSTDISCADFFPAILQDNKRATLLGTRTAGAGGAVKSATYPNRFGVASFRYTSSIAERSDKSPIENRGVTPDIAYSLTENDLQNGYGDYRKAINSAVKALLRPIASSHE